MTKILLTGFGPFLQNSFNPSSEIVDDLKTTILNSKKNYQIDTLKLNVTYADSLKSFLSQTIKTEYDFIIHFGLASNRSRIGLERIAINCIDSNNQDCNGVMIRGQRIIATGPDGIFTNISNHISELVRELDIPSELEVSNTCGTYVCNYLYYHSLFRYQDNAKILFIHIPQYEKISKERQLKIIALILTRFLEQKA